MLLFEVRFYLCLVSAIDNECLQQALWENMNSIIDNWKISDSNEEGKWRKAANQWRLPYWDWAIPQPYINNFGVPKVCTYEEVTISMPYGKTRTITNPLKQFSNPKKDAGGLPVPMGDPSMGENAIKCDDPNQGLKHPRKPRYHILPVSKIERLKMLLRKYSGMNVWALVDTVSQTSITTCFHQSGLQESTTGRERIQAYNVLDGMEEILPKTEITLSTLQLAACCRQATLLLSNFSLQRNGIRRPWNRTLITCLLNISTMLCT